MMMNLNSSLKPCDPKKSLKPLLFEQNALINSKLLYKRCPFVLPRNRNSRVFCESETKEMQFRKFSPILESVLVSGNRVLPSKEWTTVPDIWSTSAEKFGERTALIDPYHEPPTNMTYKQLEKEILNFCEGLRVIGLKPDEKIALFADNSCRWLIADQGIMATGAINVVRGTRSSAEELLQIYKHSESVALVVDDPTMFNKILGIFNSQVTISFVIVLWGDKSSITNAEALEMPIYGYKEIIDLGLASRATLLRSEDDSWKDATFIMKLVVIKQLRGDDDAAAQQKIYKIKELLEQKVEDLVIILSNGGVYGGDEGNTEEITGPNKDDPAHTLLVPGTAYHTFIERISELLGRRTR